MQWHLFLSIPVTKRASSNWAGKISTAIQLDISFWRAGTGCHDRPQSYITQTDSYIRICLLSSLRCSKMITAAIADSWCCRRSCQWCLLEIFVFAGSASPVPTAFSGVSSMKFIRKNSPVNSEWRGEIIRAPLEWRPCVDSRFLRDVHALIPIDDTTKDGFYLDVGTLKATQKEDLGKHVTTSPLNHDNCSRLWRWWSVGECSSLHKDVRSYFCSQLIPTAETVANVIPVYKKKLQKSLSRILSITWRKKARKQLYFLSGPTAGQFWIRLTFT